VDLSGDLDYILRIIDKGTNVGFDTIGKINYQPEEVRINLLKELCKRGLSEKVVMSLDITRKSHLRYKGGIGYSYLLDCFIPNLEEAGIDESDIENMIKNNPLRIFLE
jgi:phosphotriesterase-related protein